MKSSKSLKLKRSRMMPPHKSIFSGNVVAFTSDRTVDFSLDDQQSALTQSQREFLSSQVNSDLPEPVSVRQVHGGKILVADGDFPQRGFELERADGLITKNTYLPLAVRSADCLPIFFYDEVQGGIGIVHVGWKGCLKNITKTTVELMAAQWKSDPRDLKVYFGPAIRCCCYEVGLEFKNYFTNHVHERDGRCYFDLAEINYQCLIRLGVKKTNIVDDGICTYCDKNYFSFRRERKDAGRMISCIMLKDER